MVKRIHVRRHRYLVAAILVGMLTVPEIFPAGWRGRADEARRNRAHGAVTLPEFRGN